ncbi:hypothetical protein HK098_004105 [Nowakowskiella sp. JEL0407]|nr:hypothetical protein HK098_004105 [Nowakowskiella sp. JEL0407]
MDENPYYKQNTANTTISSAIPRRTQSLLISRSKRPFKFERRLSSDQAKIPAAPEPNNTSTETISPTFSLKQAFEKPAKYFNALYRNKSFKLPRDKIDEAPVFPSISETLKANICAPEDIWAPSSPSLPEIYEIPSEITSNSPRNPAPAKRATKAKRYQPSPNTPQELADRDLNVDYFIIPSSKPHVNILESESEDEITDREESFECNSIASTFFSHSNSSRRTFSDSFYFDSVGTLTNSTERSYKDKPYQSNNSRDTLFQQYSQLRQLTYSPSRLGRPIPPLSMAMLHIPPNLSRSPTPSDTSSQNLGSTPRTPLFTNANCTPEPKTHVKSASVAGIINHSHVEKLKNEIDERVSFDSVRSFESDISLSKYLK